MYTINCKSGESHAGVLNLKLPGAANAAPQLFPGLQQVIVVHVRLESSGKNQ